MPHLIDVSSCDGAKHLSAADMIELDSVVFGAFLIDGKQYALAVNDEGTLVGYHSLNDEEYEMSQEGEGEEFEPANSLEQAYEIMLQASQRTEEMIALHGAEVGASFYAANGGTCPTSD